MELHCEGNRFVQCEFMTSVQYDEVLILKVNVSLLKKLIFCSFNAGFVSISLFPFVPVGSGC